MELAIVAQEAAGAVAQVEGLAVEAHAAVEARVGQTFVTVDTALPVQCHDFRLATTFVWFYFAQRVRIVLTLFKSDYYQLSPL